MSHRFFLQFGSRSIAVPTGKLAIGRSEQAGLRIADPRVSREHAAIHNDAAGIRISDFGSHNGVYVNGRRITGTVALSDGDRISVGSVDFTIRSIGVEIDATAREALRDDADGGDRLASLTHREREVFELLARGHALKTIGERLGISAKTIETYRTRIGEKLGTPTRALLIRFALRAGILNDECDDTGS